MAAVLLRPLSALSPQSAGHEEGVLGSVGCEVRVDSESEGGRGRGKGGGGWMYVGQMKKEGHGVRRALTCE